MPSMLFGCWSQGSVMLPEGALPGKARVLLNVRAAESQEIHELKREVAELRWATEVLRTASVLFAATELDRRLK